MQKFMRIGVMLALSASTFIFASPSEAQCTPNPPASGSTVVCTGTTTTPINAATSNNVTIEVQAGATVQNPNDGQDAIRVGNGATLTNNGTIAGDGRGDGFHSYSGANVTNNGTIYSELHEAVDVGSGSTVVNNGTIYTGIAGNNSVGDIGIDIGGNSTVQNNGTISANMGDGIYSLSGTTITNNGTINSNYQEAIDGKDNMTINNYGTVTTGLNGGREGIEADNYSTVNNYGDVIAGCDAIEVVANSEVNNHEEATVYSEGCNGIDAGMGSVVNNDGTIQTGMTGGNAGVQLAYNGELNNSATGDIEGRCRAVRATSNATVNNDGDMHGEVCDGVDIDGVGTVVNNGTITTGVNADAGVEMNSGTLENNGTIDAGGNGVKIVGADTNSSTIINDGTIQGNVGINASLSSGSQTVVNNGTIIGETGTAIRLGAGDDQADILAGSTVQGTIDGGTEHDILTFRYRFEATDFYIPAEYTAMEATIMAAPTTGCPCTIELVVSGTTYRYRYTNFEQLQAFLEFVQIQVSGGADDTVRLGNNVSSYAMTENGFRTGVISVYQADSGSGVHVATFNAWETTSGGSFTSADGWTVTVSAAVMEGTTQVLSMSVIDPHSNVRSTSHILLFDNGSMAWR